MPHLFGTIGARIKGLGAKPPNISRIVFFRLTKTRAISLHVKWLRRKLGVQFFGGGPSLWHKHQLSRHQYQMTVMCDSTMTPYIAAIAELSGGPSSSPPPGAVRTLWHWYIKQQILIWQKRRLPNKWVCFYGTPLISPWQYILPPSLMGHLS